MVIKMSIYCTVLVTKHLSGEMSRPKIILGAYVEPRGPSCQLGQLSSCVSGDLGLFLSTPMPGSNDLSAAARLHVVKTERSDDMQERGKGKTKGKGKGKGKAKGGNQVRGGSPVRERAAGSKHGTDHWDDLRHAWAAELSQSKKGGGHGQGSRHNHNHDHPQQQQQQQQHERQHHNHNHHPNAQQSASGSGQNRQGRGGGGGGGGGGHVHAGQKRRMTETTTNGPAENGRHASKRRKSERQPPPDSNSNSGSGGAGGAQPHPDFWHPDGSVIVQVEKTKFRLHQSTLQKHSAYFAAMFLEKKGGNRRYLEVEVDERSPNGGHLPVYRVSETTADDFASLLSLIEEPM